MTQAKFLVYVGGLVFHVTEPVPSVGQLLGAGLFLYLLLENVLRGVHRSSPIRAHSRSGTLFTLMAGPFQPAFAQ